VPRKTQSLSKVFFKRQLNYLLVLFFFLPALMMAILKPRTWFCLRQRVADRGSPCICRTLNQECCDSKERSKNGVELRFGMLKKKGAARLSLRCCNNGGARPDDSSNWFKEEEDEFVKMMREAQPYFQAYRGSTFVTILSAEIVDSPYLPYILEVLLSPSASLHYHPSISRS
jgi:hypothetical protein